jgi:uncharacterized lipoprotein YajG
MKSTALLISAFLVAGVASAAQTTTATTTTKPAATKAAAVKPATVKTHDVEAEVVSADTKASTLTIKGEKENAILKVDASAASQLKAVKAGEKVKLTCRDNDKGEHEAITHIAAVKAKATASVKK